MSLGIILTRAEYGMASPLVRVEAHLSPGLPRFNIVGLPEKAVNESRARVRSAIINCGFVFPTRHITINLSPADLPKSGGRFDLAIALSILAATKQIKIDELGNYEFLGELALNGELLPAQGVILAGLACANAKRNMIISKRNAVAAAVLKPAPIYFAEHLIQVTAHLNGVKPLPSIADTPLPEQPKAAPGPSLNSVRGQRKAKRALVIAAAGGHNLLMFGPPGSGKTMLARRLPALLPPLNHAESLEVASIFSLTSKESPAIWGRRPFRAPHHTASAAALVGGGRKPMPGEISLAHLGTLFLDELPEFPRNVLEALRQPMESGNITISRATFKTDFPARFQLVAAMNPCPCGLLGNPYKECRCSPQQIANYRSKISGPLLDRIDLIIYVANVPAKEHNASNDQAEHQQAQEVINLARERQIKRNSKINALLDADETHYFCAPDKGGQGVINAARAKLGISMRGYHRLLRVARTLADLEGAEQISKQHILEALAYRCDFDRAPLSHDQSQE